LTKQPRSFEQYKEGFDMREASILVGTHDVKIAGRIARLANLYLYLCTS